jgi:hypothetical protein
MRCLSVRGVGQQRMLRRKIGAPLTEIGCFGKRGAM